MIDVKRARAWAAVATVASLLGAGNAAAQKVEFKTMEMRTISEPPGAVFIQVSQRGTAGKRARHVVKRCSARKPAARRAARRTLAEGGKRAATIALAGGGASSIYDRNSVMKRVRVQ